MTPSVLLSRPALERGKNREILDRKEREGQKDVRSKEGYLMIVFSLSLTTSVTESSVPLSALPSIGVVASIQGLGLPARIPSHTGRDGRSNVRGERSSPSFIWPAMLAIRYRATGSEGACHSDLIANPVSAAGYSLQAKNPDTRKKVCLSPRRFPGVSLSNSARKEPSKPVAGCCRCVATSSHTSACVASGAQTRACFRPDRDHATWGTWDVDENEAGSTVLVARLHVTFHFENVVYVGYAL